MVKTRTTSKKQPIVTVQDLTKRYDNKAVVDGISFEVMEGEVFGILGPNGAGKTTTLEMIESMRPIDAGSVTLCDIDVAARPDAIKAVIGVQPQTPAFEEKVTLKELIEFFASTYGDTVDVEAVLKDVQLTDKINSYPEQLSGGQRQRFSIATALVHGPKVFFLDEPTTGLDPQARRNLWDLIRHIQSKGVTVIMTTHYMDEAEQLCDRIAVMDNGKIVALDTPQNLIKALLSRGFKKPQHVEQANLEDVFIDLTGKELRESHMSLKRKFLPVWTFAKLDVKRLFRDKVGIFFVFVFPLIFLIVFGFIFGRDDGSVSFNVALINQSQTEPARQFEDQIRKSDVIKVKDASSEQDALQKMKRGELDSVIVLPGDFGATKEGQQTPSGQAIVRYDQNKAQAGTTLTSVLQEGVFKPINQRLAPSSDPFTAVARSTSTEGLRQFDFTFAGLLGFTLLTSVIFGPTSVFPRLKQRGVLRRYSTTTLKVWQYFTANVLSNGVVALMSLAVMFIVAQLMFGVTMRGDYLTLAAFATIGATLMFGIGLSIGGWAKNENQAAPLGQIVSFPMMFLSGIFFPTFLMPGWLQNITQFIPLTPVVDGIRLILTEGYTLVQLGPQLLIMGVWLVVVYLIAFKVFRWE